MQNSQPPSDDSQLQSADSAQQQTTNTPNSKASRVSYKRRGLGLLIIIILSGFLAGAGGSYAVIKSGLLGQNTQSINNNRETIVLQEGELIADIAAKVSPSVVSITTQTLTAGATLRPQLQQGAASGFIVSSDGYVVTNRHVVPEGTGKVTIVASDGTTYSDVAIIGRDSLNDLAFLKINNVSNLKPVELGDSTSVKVGQKVIAIGNALGEFQNSVTSGIISGLGRPIQASADGTSTNSESLANLFQTDAAINPGNSGGPLLNLQGEVIGINVAVAQGSQSIGFAIPINDGKGLIDSVIKTGKFERGLLGVRYVAIDNQIAKQKKLPVSEGALLVGSADSPAIAPNSGAAKAGLKANDIITKVNDVKITAGNSLAGLLGQYKPGDSVKLTVLRGDKELTLEVKLQSSL